MPYMLLESDTLGAIGTPGTQTIRIVIGAPRQTVAAPRPVSGWKATGKRERLPGEDDIAFYFRTAQETVKKRRKEMAPRELSGGRIEEVYGGRRSGVVRHGTTENRAVAQGRIDAQIASTIKGGMNPNMPALLRRVWNLNGVPVAAAMDPAFPAHEGQRAMQRYEQVFKAYNKTPWPEIGGYKDWWKRCAWGAKIAAGLGLSSPRFYTDKFNRAFWAKTGGQLDTLSIDRLMAIGFSDAIMKLQTCVIHKYKKWQRGKVGQAKTWTNLQGGLVGVLLREVGSALTFGLFDLIGVIQRPEMDIVEKQLFMSKAFQQMDPGIQRLYRYWLGIMKKFNERKLLREAAAPEAQPIVAEMRRKNGVAAGRKAEGTVKAAATVGAAWGLVKLIGLAL